MPRRGVKLYKFTVLLSSQSFSLTNKLVIDQGLIGDQPALMDYNGDGRTDIGWVRASSTSGVGSAALTCD